MQESLTACDAGELPVTALCKDSINPLPAKSEDKKIRPSSGLDAEEFNALVEQAREFGSRYGDPFKKAAHNFAQAFSKNVDKFVRLRAMFLCFFENIPVAHSIPFQDQLLLTRCSQTGSVLRSAGFPGLPLPASP